VKQQEKTLLPRMLKKITFASIDEWFSKKFLRRDISEITVYLSVLCYTLIFSYFTILKYNSFHAYAWDLGIFDQSLWTTLHCGKLFFSTVEQFIIPSGVFFGTHFSPILFLVLPVYSLSSSPETLLIFQSFILALGAVPLYFFAKNTLNNKVIAVAFSLAYLLYPPLQGVNWFDFHVQAFLPLFFLCAVYFLSKEKWPYYFLFIFLSLAVAENVPITVVFLGIYCFWRFRKQIIEAIKTRRLFDKRLIVPILTIVVALLWIFFAGWIQQAYFPINPAFTQLYKAVSHWSVLGVKDDPIKLPIYLITTPGRALDALYYDFPLKLIYLILLFGPLLFLSFRSSITAVSLAWLVPAMFSNYSPYYTIGDHYPAYIVAFIFLGAVEAIKKDKKSFSLPTLSSYTKKLLFIGLLFTLFVSPLSPVITTWGNSFPHFADYHLPTMTGHEELLQTIADIVPDNASILTINNIFPHFSRRIDAYVYPLDSMIQGYNGTELQNYIGDLFKKSDYVMTDNTTDPYTTNLIFSRIQSVDYGRLYAYGDGIYLFKKNYSGETLTFYA
jgi:uncharacterized membrane protein